MTVGRKQGGKASWKRKTDTKGRITLPLSFADHLVTVEQVSEDELLIRKTQVLPKKYTLAQLLAQVKPEHHRGEISTGPAVGNEAW